MASAVALPLEKQFATIAGLTSINSTSTQGSTNITLQFDLSRNIDAAAQDVQAMIAQAARSCRRRCRRRRRTRRSTRPTSRCCSWCCSSATLPLSIVDEYARDRPRAAASRWSAASPQVNVFGAQKYAVRVDVDPRKLAARRHRHRRGRAARSPSANVNLPTGTLYGADTHTSSCRPTASCSSAAAYRPDRSSPTATATRCGSTKSRTSTTASRTTRTASWYERRRAASTSPIQKQPGTNTVAVVDAIKALLPTLSAQLPAAVTLDIRSDRSLADPRVGARRQVHAAAHRRASSSW